MPCCQIRQFSASSSLDLAIETSVQASFQPVSLVLWNRRAAGLTNPATKNEIKRNIFLLRRNLTIALEQYLHLRKLCYNDKHEATNVLHAKYPRPRISAGLLYFKLTVSHTVAQFHPPSPTVTLKE